MSYGGQTLHQLVITKFPEHVTACISTAVQEKDVYKKLLRYINRSLTLGEECRLKIFEYRVLRRIFGPKRDEVTREWRRLHNRELYALYSSPNINQ
jgi:hypothetical protein